MEEMLRQWATGFGQSALLAANILVQLFLPALICCLLLRLSASFQEKMLWRVGGYHGVLSTAWIGTPVHELSHLLMALVFLRKIERVELFKPDREAGKLGSVVHSYPRGSIIQELLGNPIIAIAPFFGGSLALYGLLKLLAPQFSLPPGERYLTLDGAISKETLYAFWNSVVAYFRHIFDILSAQQLWHDWKFYLFLYLSLCISSNLSPSGKDFRVFFKPAIALVILAIVVIALLKPFVDAPAFIIQYGSPWIATINSLLYLALSASLVGCILISLVALGKSILAAGREDS